MLALMGFVAGGAAQTPKPPVQDKSPYDPNAKHGSYAYCFQVAADYTVYITPVWNAESVSVQDASGEFGKFLQKTYGAQPGAGCPAEASQASAEQARQFRIDRMKRDTPPTRTLKFVEVDWKPTPKPAPSAPAQGSVPSASTPTGADAYQKALEAGRPRSNGGATPTPAPTASAAATPKPTASPAATPKPAAQTGPLMMFCSAVGMPHNARQSAASHFYITKLFPRPEAPRPEDAFQAFLKDAHKDENINGARCQYSADAATVQGWRQKNIDSQRATPSREIVEVDWKGGQ